MVTVYPVVAISNKSTIYEGRLCLEIAGGTNMNSLFVVHKNRVCNRWFPIVNAHPL